MGDFWDGTDSTRRQRGPSRGGKGRQRSDLERSRAARERFGSDWDSLLVTSGQKDGGKS